MTVLDALRMIEWKYRDLTRKAANRQQTSPQQAITIRQQLREIRRQRKELRKGQGTYTRGRLKMTTSKYQAHGTLTMPVEVEGNPIYTDDIIKFDGDFHVRKGINHLSEMPFIATDIKFDWEKSENGNWTGQLSMPLSMIIVDAENAKDAVDIAEIILNESNLLKLDRDVYTWDGHVRPLIASERVTIDWYDARLANTYY